MNKKTERAHRTPVQLGLTKEKHIELKKHAAERGLSLASWMRRLALREMLRERREGL